MDWRAVKQEVRDIVHETMGYTCVYEYGSETPINCTVRHHRASAFIGDDTDEFSPGLLSQINRVIVDLREVPSPKRNATFTFVDDEGQPIPDAPVLTLLTTIAQGEFKVMCEVKS